MAAVAYLKVGGLPGGLYAAGICLAFGLDLDAVAEGLRTFPGVPGRLERVELGQPFRVYIDYAHASGSLASSLAAVRTVTPGRLLAVFGCSARSDGHDPSGMGPVHRQQR